MEQAPGDRPGSVRRQGVERAKVRAPAVDVRAVRRSRTVLARHLLAWPIER